MPKKLRLKPCPKKPVRKKMQYFTEDVKDCSGTWLKNSLETLEGRGVDLDKVTMTVYMEDGYYNNIECKGELSWREDETQENFDKRMATYEKKLSTYNKWAEANQDAIAERKAQDIAEKQEKKQAKIDREIAAAEVKLKKLQRLKDKGL